MKTKQTGSGEHIIGQGMTGTGGDFLDQGDVEGHVLKRGTDDVLKRDVETGVTKRDGDDYRAKDVEGHVTKRDVEGDGIHMKLPKGTDDEARAKDSDVEGHLYHGGPTTQGEARQRDILGEGVARRDIEGDGVHKL